MAERKLNSLYIRLNNEETIEVKQNKLKAFLANESNKLSKLFSKLKTIEKR